MRTWGVFFVGLALAACGSDGDSSAAEVSFTTPPLLSVGEAGVAPQAAAITFETNVATTVRFDITGGDESWSVERNDAATAHDDYLLGFKADTAYEIVLTVTSEDGAELSDAGLSLTTPALPEDFPVVTLVKSEAGATPLDVLLCTGKYSMVLNRQAEVVWYAASPVPCILIEVLPNGDLLQLLGGNTGRQIDWLGRAVHTWHARDFPDSTPLAGSVPVAADSFHHELLAMPNGNIATLSTEARSHDNYPTTYDADPPLETADVIGDVIVEFAPDGSIVKEIDLLDILDPYRIGYNSLGGFWTGQYGDSRDWSHANAVAYDAEDDAYLVSVRHQDAIVKVSRASGELIWILGTDDNWKAAYDDNLFTPQGDLKWHFHQHAVKVLPGGDIGLFDNQTSGASPPELELEDLKSRAVRFSLNEQTMTAQQVWTYGPDSGDDAFFSKIQGEADWLANGNVHVTISAPIVMGSQKAVLVEVTESGERVLEIAFGDPMVPGNVRVYRSSRIPSIRE